jgi:hypothetical protein
LYQEGGSFNCYQEGGSLIGNRNKVTL